MAIAGGAALAHTNGIFTALAVNALNTLVGNIDRPGGISFTPQLDVAAALKAPAPGAPPAPALAQWSAALASGSMAEVLFVDGVNPVFTAPPAWRVRDGLDKVPYIVSFGSFLDETSVMADLILPDHSFLESWMEAVPESGAHTSVASVAPAVMRPLSRHARHAGRAARHWGPAATAARASVEDRSKKCSRPRSGRCLQPHRMWMHGPTHRARGCGRARFRQRWRVSRSSQPCAGCRTSV